MSGNSLKVSNVQLLFAVLLYPSSHVPTQVNTLIEVIGSHIYFLTIAIMANHIHIQRLQLASKNESWLELVVTSFALPEQSILSHNAHAK